LQRVERFCTAELRQPHGGHAARRRTALSAMTVFERADRGTKAAAR